jgi:hypothetical protein
MGCILQRKISISSEEKRMGIDLILPYVKRLKRSHPKLKACVYEYNETYRKVLKETGLFDEIGDDPKDAHLVVFGFKKVNEETLNTEFWDVAVVDAWVVLFDSPENLELIEKWRKKNKVTSLLTRMDEVIFFQKEDYSDRDKTGNNLIENLAHPAIKDDEPLIEQPDWTTSHLKEEYLQRHGNGKVFIETGTYLGQTVELARRVLKDNLPMWDRIESIEINKRLADNAKKYFDFDARININLGDSVDVIKTLCEGLKDEPATFWLDAHASGPLPGGRMGPNPLLQELEAIYLTGRKDHTIIVDDRRLFGSGEWGGLQETQIMEWINKINPDYKIFYLDGEVKGDILCATVVDRPWTKPDNTELPENVRKFFKLDEKKPVAEEKEKPKFIFMD